VVSTEPEEKVLYDVYRIKLVPSFITTLTASPMLYKQSPIVAAIAMILVTSSLLGGMATPAVADTITSGPGTLLVKTSDDRNERGSIQRVYAEHSIRKKQQLATSFFLFYY